jgi:hypothetical protein
MSFLRRLLVSTVDAVPPKDQEAHILSLVQAVAHVSAVAAGNFE